MMTTWDTVVKFTLSRNTRPTVRGGLPTGHSDHMVYVVSSSITQTAFPFTACWCMLPGRQWRKLLSTFKPGWSHLRQQWYNCPHMCPVFAQLSRDTFPSRPHSDGTNSALRLGQANTVAEFTLIKDLANKGCAEKAFKKKTTKNKQWDFFDEKNIANHWILQGNLWQSCLSAKNSTLIWEKENKTF